jgi:hypothetical protein
MTVQEVCQRIKNKYNIISKENLDQASVSVRHHWDVLSCEETLKYPSQSNNNAIPSSTVSAINDLKMTSIKKKIHHDHTEQQYSEIKISDKNDSEEKKNIRLQCNSMKDEYHVVPGSSWGSLPIPKQK